MDSKDDIKIKYEPLDYDVDSLNCASGSEGANVIRVLKNELKDEVNIKCEPLDYARKDTDSISVTGFHSTLATEKCIKREVEEQEKEEKIDIKYESLDYGLKRPAIDNTNEHAEKLFECHKCSYKSKYKPTLKRHIMTIHEKEEMPRHACQLCSFKTFHASYLNRHIRFKHAENTKQFECSKCSYKSISKYLLKKHIMISHEKEKMPWNACQLCSYKTLYAHHLNRHIRIKHAENRDQFECHKCSFKSGDKQYLKKHILSIHEKEKAYQHTCDICSFRSIHRSSLKLHILRIHTEYKLKCILCQKSFKRKVSLDSHYVSTHRDQNDSFKHLLTNTVSQCPKCSYVTGDLAGFKRHILLTHQEDRSKFNFECYTCGNKYLRKSSLKTHVRLHTGQLPFSCSECNKKFMLKHHLDGHILSRHRENEEVMKIVTSKIHQCPKCSFKSIKSTDLKTHKCNNK